MSFLGTKVNKHASWAAAATLIVALLSIALYSRFTLRGNFDWFTLPGEKFGIPRSLASQGIITIPIDLGYDGWDGQFYYSIANDLFANEDTLGHIDDPPYR